MDMENMERRTIHPRDGFSSGARSAMAMLLPSCSKCSKDAPWDASAGSGDAAAPAAAAPASRARSLVFVAGCKKAEYDWPAGAKKQTRTAAIAAKVSTTIRLDRVRMADIAGFPGRKSSQQMV
eukprot:TRINITY_DN7905_c0_g1_i2.p3 TRINITY_DN7905_c0_g1~~TRINITY_DN7905_c0_g1_i2.p3  ORF type:complete len:123 (-),score=32.77 TRINITY_DN7905_c0_g1_i2:26-394(-)